MRPPHPAPRLSSRLPRLTDSVVVVEPPDAGSGSWAGAPSVACYNGHIYLAYRLRRPLAHGRGFRNVVARSDDGVRFEAVLTIDRDAFGAESLERPCLVPTDAGRWHLYVSCATPWTKHWRVELLVADTVDGLSAATPRTVLPGDARHAVKDPVVFIDRGRWHLWASVHPLDSWDAADRMTTEYATSSDGISWTWRGTVLAPRVGQWDARGVRASAVLVDGDDLFTTYDGRATAGQNWEEVTGVAIGRRDDEGNFGPLTPVCNEPLTAASPRKGLRYLAVLRLPDGSLRWYYEITRRDGAHELRTELVTP